METWIVADAEHLGGSPRVRGIRISVSLILESLAVGMSIAETLGQDPGAWDRNHAQALRLDLGNLAGTGSISRSKVPQPGWRRRLQVEGEGRGTQ